MIHEYPFSLTKTGRCKSGEIQNETTFEGIVVHSLDDEIELDVYCVAADMTGFTLYQDGKKVASCDDLYIPAHKVVVDMEAFEAECINLAVPNAKIKCAECAGHGLIEKTIYRGDEGMEIELDVMVDCPGCDGIGMG